MSLELVSAVERHDTGVQIEVFDAFEARLFHHVLERLLVGVQALVGHRPEDSQIPGRRTSLGVDGNRVALLLAVLERRCGMKLRVADVFVNIAGGVRLSEPAVDLALCVAIASSLRNKAIDAHTVVFGEVGLAGEVRAVPGVEARLGEAAKLGFKRVLLPEASRAQLEGSFALELLGVRDVYSTVTRLLGDAP